MIGLVILAIGMLFIAAAIPVGVRYTEQTLDLTLSESAAADALRQVELNLQTSRTLYDPAIAGSSGPDPFTNSRKDRIFRPRDGIYLDPALNPANDGYEPFIKVRPFVARNMSVVAIQNKIKAGDEHVDRVESIIAQYLAELGLPIDVNHWYREVDVDFAGSGGDRYALENAPPLSSMARVFPPIASTSRFTVFDFFAKAHPVGPYYHRYVSRPWPGNDNTQDPGVLPTERKQALNRRVAWTAFYRRVSYPHADQPGPDNTLNTGDEVVRPGDPLLYEIIVVVTSRPSIRHRYAMQDPTIGNLAFEQPQAIDPLNAQVAPDNLGSDLLAPVPWLITFDSTAALPTPETLGIPYDDTDAERYNRNLRQPAVDPPTLTFRITAKVDPLLPVGSVLIPAANDDRSVPVGGVLVAPIAGFVPASPQSLPIYEVVGRPDSSTVVVKNDGVYPWLNVAAGATVEQWPVWIIPPAFEQRDSDGQPVFERRSPILAVSRKFVRLTEVP